MSTDDQTCAEQLPRAAARIRGLIDGVIELTHSRGHLETRELKFRKKSHFESRKEVCMVISEPDDGPKIRCKLYRGSELPTKHHIDSHQELRLIVTVTIVIVRVRGGLARHTVDTARF